MKVVIDIPKGQYYVIKSGLYDTFSAEMKIWGLEAIRKGTPLLKALEKLLSLERKPITIPYLMHKKMDIPISECQKAYDVAIDYLRSKATMKG